MNIFSRIRQWFGGSPAKPAKSHIDQLREARKDPTSPLYLAPHHRRPSRRETPPPQSSTVGVHQNDFMPYMFLASHMPPDSTCHDTEKRKTHQVESDLPPTHHDTHHGSHDSTHDSGSSDSSSFDSGSGCSTD